MRFFALEGHVVREIILPAPSPSPLALEGRRDGYAQELAALALLDPSGEVHLVAVGAGALGLLVQGGSQFLGQDEVPGIIGVGGLLLAGVAEQSTLAVLDLGDITLFPCSAGAVG